MLGPRKNGLFFCVCKVFFFVNARRNIFPDGTKMYRREEKDFFLPVLDSVSEPELWKGKR